MVQVIPSKTEMTRIRKAQQTVKTMPEGKMISIQRNTNRPGTVYLQRKSADGREKCASCLYERDGDAKKHLFTLSPVRLHGKVLPVGRGCTGASIRRHQKLPQSWADPAWASSKMHLLAGLS